MSSHSTVVCDLKPITKGEGKLLREIVPNLSKRRIYRLLRETKGIAPFSYRGLAVELRLSSPDAVNTGLKSLERLGLIRREQRGDENRFHVLPVSRNETLPRTYRGAPSITVTSVTKGLPSKLDEGEEEQLYLAFQGRPQVAALYIHLRRSLGKEVTKQGMAQRFSRHGRTLNDWLEKLSDCGLLELRPKTLSIALNYAACLSEGEAERADVKAWLQSEAAVPARQSATELLLGKKTIGSQSSLIIDFYEKAMKARKATRPGLIVSTGSKTVNDRVARNLAKTHTFKELMPALIFFVYDWAGEATEDYGRTLMTFQKNLPAILEETNQALETPTYVQHKMKRYGLDQFFPVPEVVQRKKNEVVITNPEEIAHRAELAEIAAEVDAELAAKAAAKAAAA
ncbi:MAG: hypothetical protein IH609_17690 [Dehalococcoidia bacterium]|nr:hypothetical protein [Dehalococcoidia bacterium]